MILCSVSFAVQRKATSNLESGLRAPFKTVLARLQFCILITAEMLQRLKDWRSFSQIKSLDKVLMA